MNSANMVLIPNTIPQILKSGLIKGLSGALWVYKILIPISAFTLLLDVFHLLERLEGLVGPAMGVIHLPAKAAMPLIAGMLTGIYGGIAALAALSFTVKETTLVALFLLISHNLIQESAIQGRSGMHPLKAVSLRLASSVAVVWLIGHFWQGGVEPAPYAAVTTANSAFVPALLVWIRKTLILCLQILIILIAVMTAIAWMKARRWDVRLAAGLKPVLRVMGLGEQSGLLWLAALMFGVTYGAAVIVEEYRQGALSSAELERLHLSIGINHAIIEDPLLFVPLGVPAVWLWVPRIVAAFLAVHLLILFRRLKTQKDKNPVQPPA
jgi:hypothetical protein